MSVERRFLRGGEVVRVVARSAAADRFAVHVGENAYDFEARALADGRVLLRSGDEVLVAAAVHEGDAVVVRVRGRTWRLESARGAAAGHGAAGSGRIEAPMTGTVVDVLAREGERVEKGTPLVVLSAMKMEHKLVAGVAGAIAEVCAAPGDTVEQGALLVRIEEEADEG